MPCGSLLTAPQVGGTGSLWVSTPAHVTWLIDKWYKSEYHEIKYVLINFKQEEQNHSYILFIYWLLGEGNDNPLQWSCLENPRDGGAWWAAVYGVAQSRTRLKRLSSSSLISSLLLLWISLLKMADSKKDLMSKYDRFLNKYLFWNKHLIISKSTRFIHKRHKWLQLLKESNKLMLMIEKSPGEGQEYKERSRRATNLCLERGRTLPAVKQPEQIWLQLLCSSPQLKDLHHRAMTSLSFPARAGLWSPDLCLNRDLENFLQNLKRQSRQYGYV